MNIETSDGGPAFPYMSNVGRGNSGMTLRDWFAGQALAGIFAYYADADARRPKDMELAEDMYRIADAMLEQRNK